MTDPTGRDAARDWLRRAMEDLQRDDPLPHVEITLEMIERMEEIRVAGGDEALAAYVQDVITMREAGNRKPLAQ
jgi:hypothetical protein